MPIEFQPVPRTGAKARWFIGLACLLATMSFFSTFAAAQTWTLAWSDEFNGPAGSAPNSADWNYATGNNNGWGNNELEFYCPPGNDVAPCSAANPNIFEDGNGNLVIRAINTGGGTWTSGRMHTQGKHEFQYGRMEARMKLVPAAGFWPAFWMLGSNIGTVGWPTCGEQDIMEWVPKYTPTTTSSTVHGPGYSGGNGIGSHFTFPNGGRIDDGAYHTYGVVWSQNQMQFYRDDSTKPYFTVTPASIPAGTQWVYNHPFYVLFNFAVGGGFPGNPDGTTPSPADVLVDYVRVYTPCTTCAQSVQIDSGGAAVAPFVADMDFSGGATINHANTIDLSGVTNPAPAAVYQTARVAATAGAGTNFSYTIPGFVPGSSQLVRLHFAETFHTGTGQRVFNVSINGTQVLTNFDIFATANAMNKAVIQEFTANADANGNYTIVFTSVTDKALISGIEVNAVSTTCALPSTPTGLTATAISTSAINLGWTASTPQSGCTTTYNVYRSTTAGFTPSSANQVASGLTTTAYSDTALNCSTPYYYLVEAVTSAGSSASSNQATATTQVCTCSAAPPTPTGLSATAASTTATNLGWTASTAPPNCTVTYSVIRNGATAASGLTGTTFGDTGLTCSTAYTYTVVATDAFGSSAASSPATATTQACPCSAAPPTPTGLSATAASTSAINLGWTASAPPSNCTVTYSVTRNGASAASGLTGTTFGDSGLTCNTGYTYTVTAADAFGSSAASSAASATTSACTTSVKINAGGAAVAPFVADVDFTGGGTINHANTINLNGQPNPAPAAVYQTARAAATAGAGTTFSYTIPGYTAGSSHTVRLHFCETFWTAAGQRVFNVSINGTQVLANFDVLKTAGGQNRALIQSFTANANSSGQYVIVFTSVTDKAFISGIEVQ